MDVKKCTVCNIKIDELNNKKGRNFCKKCYDMKEKNIVKTRSLEMIIRKTKVKSLTP